MLLTYAGLQGRQQARRQAHLEDVVQIRNQLQQKLDDRGNAGPLAGALKIRLGDFDAKYRARDLPPAESLDLRLSRATLANAEQRFGDTLMLISQADEEANRQSQEARIRVLQVRADAFYGTREWQAALDRYQQMLLLKPKHLGTLARLADCQYALGRQMEALATYGELTKSHQRRGDVLRAQGKAQAADAHYQTMAQIQSLIEQERQKALPPKVE